MNYLRWSDLLFLFWIRFKEINLNYHLSLSEYIRFSRIMVMDLPPKKGISNRLLNILFRLL